MIVKVFNFIRLMRLNFNIPLFNFYPDTPDIICNYIYLLDDFGIVLQPLYLVCDGNCRTTRNPEFLPEISPRRALFLLRSDSFSVNGDRRAGNLTTTTNPSRREHVRSRWQQLTRFPANSLLLSLFPTNENYNDEYRVSRKSRCRHCNFCDKFKMSIFSINFKKETSLLRRRV